MARFGPVARTGRVIHYVRTENNGGFQTEPGPAVQQAAVKELGQPKRTPVQHGRGQLFGDGGPEAEPGCVQQPARLQHAETTDPAVVGQPKPGRLEPGQRVLRVRADRGQAQQQQSVRGERSAAQPQPAVARRVLQVYDKQLMGLGGSTDNRG